MAKCDTEDAVQGLDSVLCKIVHLAREGGVLKGSNKIKIIKPAHYYDVRSWSLYLKFKSFLKN